MALCCGRYLFFPARLDPELVRRARDRWWEMNPAPDIVKKDDPCAHFTHQRVRAT